jgi:hypothetical protein
MSLTLTLILLFACLAIAGFSGWRGARAPDPFRGPRLVPWRFIMLLSAALAMYFAAHVLALFGLLPGSNQPYVQV